MWSEYCWPQPRYPYCLRSWKNNNWWSADVCIWTAISHTHHTAHTIQKLHAVLSCCGQYSMLGCCTTCSQRSLLPPHFQSRFRLFPAGWGVKLSHGEMLPKERHAGKQIILGSLAQTQSKKLYNLIVYNVRTNRCQLIYTSTWEK